MIDVAELGIVVDTSQVRAAAADLTTWRQETVRATLR